MDTVFAMIYPIPATIAPRKRDSKLETYHFTIVNIDFKAPKIKRVNPVIIVDIKNKFSDYSFLLIKKPFHKITN